MADDVFSRRLGGLANKPSDAQSAISPLVFNTQVVSKIINPLELDPVDEEMVKDEIHWLFSAVDHLLKWQHNELLRGQPVVAPVPPNAHAQPEANNQLRSTLSDADLENLAQKSTSLLKQLNSWLNVNLGRLLDRETQRGEAGKGDSYLQSQIKDTRVRAVNTLQQIAEAMDLAYGIRVNSPTQLLEHLEGYVNPILLGTQVVAKVITPLGLSLEDEAFVTAEVNWLFSAADNFQRIYQAIVRKLAEERKNLRSAGLPKEAIITELTRRFPEIRQAEIAASKPLSVTIPSDTQSSPEATNRLLNLPDKNEISFYFDQNIIFPRKAEIAAVLHQIRIWLQSLDTLIQREANMGEEGKRNLELQNNIKANHLYILRVLKQMAEQMNEAYGILVTTPAQLIELLETGMTS